MPVLPKMDKPNAVKQRKMTKAVKKHGRVYTPQFLVCTILDFGGYNSPEILQKHVVDNSCGDGAFLIEIVDRYCNEYLKTSDDLQSLKCQLETYIHGIELDSNECLACSENLQKVADKYALPSVDWDILCADTLSVHKFDGTIHYVFGNPPYVRVHNLEDSYDSVKEYQFAGKGMTDLFIVFFEIGFKMLATNGVMCIITPSSWLSSNAGMALRKYVIAKKNLSGVIDLEHFQPFEATTYTLISRFQMGNTFETVEYCRFDDDLEKPIHIEELPLSSMEISGCFYLSSKKLLDEVRKIKTSFSNKYVSVKNGFATLADKIFIGDFTFEKGTIDILKASTGKWSKCIFPYHEDGTPQSLSGFSNCKEAYKYLESNKDTLLKDRKSENPQCWHLFGRSQALKDVCKRKYAINTIVRDVKSIRLEMVDEGKGVYSGLYILTKTDFSVIRQIVISDDFIRYVKLLKNYKSGGYFTFNSKDLEQYLNFKLSEYYGQSGFPQSDYLLF